MGCWVNGTGKGYANFFHLRTRIHMIGSQRVTKQSQDFRCHEQSTFGTQWVLDQWKVLIKVPPWSCQHCLIHVNTLTLEGCSEIEALGHSSNHITRSHYLPKYLTYKADLFFQNATNFVQIPKMLSKFEKIFSIVELVAVEQVAEILFIQQREYISSAVNVSPNSPKISDLTNRDFCQLNVSWLNGKFW